MPGSPCFCVLDVTGLRCVLAKAGRRHWQFLIVFCAGLVLRILTQVTYSPALVYIDSYRYLHGDSSLDPLGYLVLLWPLQRAGGLAAVAAAQHVLGLGVALSLYALLFRYGIWRWAAALAAAPVLLDGYQLQAEQTIMPDVLFEALIVAGLALLLWRRIPAAWQVGLAALALGVAVDVRQVGAVLGVPALAFLLARAKGWQRLTRSALLTAGVAIPVLMYHYQLHGGYTPGPLLVVATLAGLAGSCMLRLGGRRREHAGAATACLLTTAMAIILLLVSDAYEFSWRYQLPALVLLPPAGILGAAAVAAAMRGAVPKRGAAPGLSNPPPRGMAPRLSTPADR